MRIIFETTIDDIRVTGFEYEQKYSIKLEKYHLEQWYKFRDGSVPSINVLKDKVAPHIARQATLIFHSMVAARSEGIMQSIVSAEDTFDEII